MSDSHEGPDWRLIGAAKVGMPSSQIWEGPSWSDMGPARSEPLILHNTYIWLTYIIYNSNDTFEEIVKQREILLRIKNYTDISQSSFAKYFFEKCNKDKYKDIKNGKEELFDEAFDLYQKLTNIGIANRDNYLKYGYPQKLAEDNGIGLKEIFLDAIDKTKNDFTKLPNQVIDKEEIITTRTMIDGKETTKTEIKHTQLNNQPGTLIMQMQNANQFHNSI